LIQLHFLKLEVNDLALDLLGFNIAHIIKHWELDGVVKGDPEEWIEHQNSIKEVHGFSCSSWVLGGEVNAPHVAERLQVFQSLLISNKRHVVFAWGPDHIKDYRQLIICIEWEAVSLLLQIFGWREREAGLSWE
jgi:hypothetical protein